MVTTKECCEQYCTSHGGNTSQSSCCTATYRPLRKLSKLDEPGMRDTDGEVETNSLATYSYVPLSHGQAKAGRPARTYIQQLCTDTGCSLEDMPEAIDDRDGWWEKVREIRADGVTWWWWSWYIFIWKAELIWRIPTRRDFRNVLRGVITRCRLWNQNMMK